MTVTTIIILTYAIFDNASLLFSKQNEGMKNVSQCVATCSQIENMTSVSASDAASQNTQASVQPQVSVQPTQNTQQIAKDPNTQFVSYVIKPYADPNNKNGSRFEDDMITNEMNYTDFNTLPVDQESASLFEYGDSFLPPDKWYPVPPHPPVCVAEKRCPVCPITTTGTPVDAKEWNDSRRITPADNINVDYIKDKLNSGR